jgi:hypothetical protein
MIGRFGGVISAPFAILPVRTCGHSRLRLTIFTYAPSNPCAGRVGRKLHH